MKLKPEDYLKKALLDTQEKVRDYMDFSYEVDNPEVRDFLRESAKMEGLQAEKIKSYLENGKIY